MTFLLDCDVSTYECKAAGMGIECKILLLCSEYSDVTTDTIQIARVFSCIARLYIETCNLEHRMELRLMDDFVLKFVYYKRDL